MSYSTLFQISSSDIATEAEVETKFLAKVFKDLGYPDSAVIPKGKIKALKINDGVKSTKKQTDFILKDKNGIERIIVEAKDPSINILDAWGQAASYALSFNSNKDIEDRIKWLLISNGFFTALFPCDSINPIVTLQLSDFASGIPPYVTLKNHIKYGVEQQISTQQLPFKSLPPQQLNALFSDSHNLVWKKEKLAPADAFFEFCKFIFIKIRQDKERENLPPNTPIYTIPLTESWLEAQAKTSNHPVRDILFKNLHLELEDAIANSQKKRIFEKDETLKLSAATCKELISIFQSVNLSTIDEDLNGRMFEVFLAASIRGKDLGQFFTPRSVVDFMTRIALRNADPTTPPKVLDACCGTSGFLIEVMAYLLGRLRNDTRLTNTIREQIKNKICNECLYGVEANERVARIARINMYLHGDGGSHIFHGDGLDDDSQPHDDMNAQQRYNIKDYQSKVAAGTFDIVLTNPPFSMKYDKSKNDEKRILGQYTLASASATAKSSVLFLNRYYNLLRPGGEMLIVLDDTILNGKSYEYVRKWILENFILLGIHSLPFNAFFKAKANIKTSIIHLRKKWDAAEVQGAIFMSASNNIGHNNSLKDTPQRNSLLEILIAYLEWQRTGNLVETLRDHTEQAENLEAPTQYWLTKADDLLTERLDAFFYCLDLHNNSKQIKKAEEEGIIKIFPGSEFNIRLKLSSDEKNAMKSSDRTYRYIEISDVTKQGLITNFVEGKFSDLPTRGEYVIHEGDVLMALNNSSRGTVVLVPKSFDGAICTSGFLVISPKNKSEGLLLWYVLRSELCRKQIYYLAQTASQPELKIDAWNNYFQVPMPVGARKVKAIKKAQEFHDYLAKITDVNHYHLDLT